MFLNPRAGITLLYAGSPLALQPRQITCQFLHIRPVFIHQLLPVGNIFFFYLYLIHDCFSLAFVSNHDSRFLRVFRRVICSRQACHFIVSQIAKKYSTKNQTVVVQSVTPTDADYSLKGQGIKSHHLKTLRLLVRLFSMHASMVSNKSDIANNNSLSVIIFLLAKGFRPDIQGRCRSVWSRPTLCPLFCRIYFTPPPIFHAI